MSLCAFFLLAQAVLANHMQLLLAWSRMSAPCREPATVARPADATLRARERARRHKMGAYLSAPITDKEVAEGEGPTVVYGVSSMQGWRRTMEDAHLAEGQLAGDPSTAIFGVFDGHGGSEVAKFCSRYIADEFVRIREGETVEEALIKVFHRMDEMLRDTRLARRERACAPSGTNPGWHRASHQRRAPARHRAPCARLASLAAGTRRSWRGSR